MVFDDKAWNPYADFLVQHTLVSLAFSTFLDFQQDSSHMYLYHISKFDPLPRVLKASIKTPKEILFCKQTGLHILRKVRISCKGPLNTALSIVTLKTNFMFFKQHPWFFTF